MNLFGYIKKYKDKTFYEEKFNEVDNVIFSLLAYLDFTNIVSTNFSNKISLEQASIIYLKNNNQLNKSYSPVKIAIKILKDIYKSNRYKDILMYNYQNINNNKCIFRAITLEYLKNNIYIAYEGTDDLILNWKEDFEIAYRFPTFSQKYAYKYLNRRYLFSFKKIIIGGHSKGGNLALSASIKSNILLRNRIKKIYINDGLGLRNKEFNSSKYRKIKSKLIYIVPDYSIVSFLLNTGDDLHIIKSKNRNVFSHNPNVWLVDDNKFLDSEISNFSTNFKTIFSKWLNNYSDTEKENFSNEIFSLFEKCEIKSLLDLVNKKVALIKLIFNSRKFDLETKNMLKKLIKMLTISKED